VSGTFSDGLKRRGIINLPAVFIDLGGGRRKLESAGCLLIEFLYGHLIRWRGSCICRALHGGQRSGLMVGEREEQGKWALGAVLVDYDKFVRAP
jgi:hypothetical protein